MAPDPERIIALAERVAAEAEALGIECAVVGAMAAALHNYLRATQDLDLATDVHPQLQLTRLEHRLREIGLHTALRLPDESDDLGGVIDVREEPDDVEYVQVVNFYNPFTMRRTPAAAAIKTAIPMHEAKLRYVSLASLIALKLDAHGPKDRLDVLELLANNPDADFAEIHRVCSDANLEERLHAMLKDAGIAT